MAAHCLPSIRTTTKKQKNNKIETGIRSHKLGSIFCIVKRANWLRWNLIGIIWMCHRRRVGGGSWLFLHCQPLCKIIKLFSLARPEVNWSEIGCGPDEAPTKNDDSFSCSDEINAVAHYRQPLVKIDTVERAARISFQFIKYSSISSTTHVVRPQLAYNDTHQHNLIEWIK